MVTAGTHTSAPFSHQRRAAVRRSVRHYGQARPCFLSCDPLPLRSWRSHAPLRGGKDSFSRPCVVDAGSVACCWLRKGSSKGNLATGTVLGFASLYGIVPSLVARSGAWVAPMGSCCCARIASLLPATDAWFDPVARVAANEADGNPAAAAIGFIRHMLFWRVGL